MKKRYQILRKKYPFFIYKGFSFKRIKNYLIINFQFEIPPDIQFSPKIKLENVTLTKIDKETFNNFIFHLGLIEMINYWKSTCSPNIVIKAGHLSKEQIKWWKDLITNGMGQYFYENKINFRERNFINIFTVPKKKKIKIDKAKKKEEVIIPIGGGKDSVVTLEKIKKNQFER